MKYFWSYKKEYKKLRKSILKSVDKSLKSGNIFLEMNLLNLKKIFKKLNKSKYGLAVGSGTEALYIALKVLVTVMRLSQFLILRYLLPQLSLALGRKSNLLI